ncbi:MmpS family transport accessory protein [Mycolicibacterium smegmatis]|uniref:MmpS3 protein n=2 Tax=Mycolicibacterium smegmatis TaxID=1772 RepID=A0QTR1_MYCS2|nr:MmpS family transport accessory protein [Mycolicibacterium smegmatis]ABK73072.1 MmpS3 protein [Mycolicibacterium smegmatis MC2 155]AIU07153.1 hypothetical protein LJ00_09645 [Mycolicibacterium smegmatis MC2 155]AIU13778.1 hypothetical protein LI99_09645 [Mycolicibacterium smegmatis]AIU20402.1 hypothetical protein LI98_09645 [Mycolicibacterium smegmatis]MBE9619712.1 hypothetical protein [Mycolicibacterium smegmatis]
MTRPYSPYDTATTNRHGDHAPEPGSYHGSQGYGYGSGYGRGAYAGDYQDYDDYVRADGGNGGFDDGYDDPDIEFYEEPLDRRWIWVAGVAGAILLVAVICTVVILGGGDSGSVSATVADPTQTSQPATTAPQDASSTPRPLPPVAPSLSPETVTTVTPSPTAPAATAEPAPVAPPAEAAPPPAVNPRAVTYTVTGNRQLIDLVTIVYTDERGALQTDINVALPWTKTVVLDPGVELKSVTATSVAGQLNCSITDAAGNVLVNQANNTMIATCTQ